MDAILPELLFGILYACWCSNWKGKLEVWRRTQLFLSLKTIKGSFECICNVPPCCRMDFARSFWVVLRHWNDAAQRFIFTLYANANRVSYTSPPVDSICEIYCPSCPLTSMLLAIEWLWYYSKEGVFPVLREPMEFNIMTYSNFLLLAIIWVQHYEVF